MAYRVFIAADVIEILRRCPRKEQEILTRIMDDLGRDPFRTGDYVEADEVGRPIQVLIGGRHALYFWADHPVKEIKIIDLKLAGD